MRITVTSSLNEITTDRLGKGGGGSPSLPRHSSLKIFKDDVNDFSSTSDVCFMLFMSGILLKRFFCSFQLQCCDNKITLEPEGGGGGRVYNNVCTTCSVSM
jgi:hypothetical protein